jgi:hypothetical protein
MWKKHHNTIVVSLHAPWELGVSMLLGGMLVREMDAIKDTERNGEPDSMEYELLSFERVTWERWAVEEKIIVPPTIRVKPIIWTVEPPHSKKGLIYQWPATKWSQDCSHIIANVIELDISRWLNIRDSRKSACGRSKLGD